MKRKVSAGSRDAIAPAQKKLAKVFAEGKSQPCYLLQVLAQYGLLVGIASNLFPKDLYALAATSKGAYRAIFACHESHANLLGKMACDGRGMALRRQYHHIVSQQFRPSSCKAWFQCGASGAGVPTWACSECNHMTCDECRIHCVYQTIYDDPDADDELPKLSGFALLSGHEMGILTPSHLRLDNRATREQQIYVGLSVPYHDLGFLEAPLTSNTYTSPESIVDIIHFDLGTGPLKLSGNSTATHPSPIIQPFWEVTEARKRWLCDKCVSEWRDRAGYRHERLDCHCNLKERFLDRWLCLPCYRREIDEAKNALVPSESAYGKSACNSCGDRVWDEFLCRVCAWCLGDCWEPTSGPRT